MFVISLVDGMWTEWSKFTECSVTCGGGYKTRNRSCDNPAPQYGGKICAGDQINRENCSMIHCPSEQTEYFDSIEIKSSFNLIK